MNESYLNQINFMQKIGKDLLNIESLQDFQNSPIAQDFAAIISFSGIPKNGKSFVDRYYSIKLTARDNGYTNLHKNWDSKILNQTFKIKFGAVLDNESYLR